MKIICIGRNYVDHARELNNPVPNEPLVFMKPPTALLVNGKPLYYPAFTSDLHYEGELVIKICKNGRHVEPQFARNYYKEIALGFDFTARDVQTELKKKGHPWEISKGFDGSAAIGRFKDIGDRNPKELEFVIKKNGEQVQHGKISDLIFDLDSLIVHVSKYFKLQMGDYIFTGTPAGVGPVNIGDKLEGYFEEERVLSCEIK